ncbi:MAG: DMT family transporter [Breoghania sp.]|nr:DMT family transporter [Breoghania sp.]
MLYLGLSFLGLRTISPEATILIVSLAPFVTSGISIMLGGASSIRHFAGMAVGFLSVYVVLSLRLHGGEDIWGMVLVALAMVSFSVGMLWYQRTSMHHDAIALNGGQNLSAGIMLVPFADQLGGLETSLGYPVFAGTFLHLVIGVSVIDFLIWLALLRRIEAGIAASFHLLNPVFGIVLSWLLIGSVIEGTDLLGALLVLIGLGLVMSVTASKKTTKLGS